MVLTSVVPLLGVLALKRSMVWGRAMGQARIPEHVHTRVQPRRIE